MSIEKNKEIVLEFFRFLNEQKMNEAFNLFHEDLNWWVIGNLPISGNYDKRKISLGLKMLHRNFSDYIFTQSTMTAEENRVSILLESHAVRKSNQKKYNNHFHFLFTLKDDKIISVKEFFDTVHVLWIEEP